MGYQPRSTVKASIILVFFSVSLFAVFLSCKDRCLFYGNFQNHYWIPFWVAVLGIFLGCIGVAMSCAKNSRGQCQGRIFCIFVSLYLLCSLLAVLFAARPVLGHLPFTLNNQTSIPFLTDFATAMKGNRTSVNTDLLSSESFIHWAAMAGIAACLALVSLVMCCMFSCCCQEEQDPYESVPTTLRRKKTTKKEKKQRERQQQQQQQQQQQANMANGKPRNRPPGNANVQVTVQMDHIRNVPAATEEPRPPPYAPTDPAGEAGGFSTATLFGHASAPSFEGSATLQRDIARRESGWRNPDAAPDPPNTPRPNTLNRAANPGELPPAVPSTPRPNTLNRQAGNTDNNVPDTLDRQTDIRVVATALEEFRNNLDTDNSASYNYPYLEPMAPDYVEPNEPNRERLVGRDSDYLTPTPDPAQYIEALPAPDDEPASYNYAYDHDINAIARGNNTGRRPANTSTTTTADNIVSADDYMEPVDNNASAEISYY